MNASHSWPVIFRCACESAIGLPVYFCRPPLAQHTISVTRYLNPAGGTRWCASSTRGFAFSLGSTMTRSIKSSTTVAMLKTPPSLSYREGFSAEVIVGTPLRGISLPERPRTPGDLIQFWIGPVSPECEPTHRLPIAARLRASLEPARSGLHQ